MTDQQTVTLPIQLKNPDFKFILIRMEGQKRYKAPQEKNFLLFNNYPFIDPKLKNWISQGNNYGILTGIKTAYGYLTVIDTDSSETTNIAIQHLPETFRVLTGSGGYHFYYFTKNQMDTKPLDLNGTNIGHIKGKGSYVVGPGCIHEDGFYSVNGPNRIATVEDTRIFSVFSEFIKDISKVKITVTQEIETQNIMSSDISNFPLSKKHIGSDYWRKKTNQVILAADPTPKDRVGCVCTLMNLAKWDSEKILDFLGRFCRWSDFDFNISREHISYIFNRYGHSFPTKRLDANRGVFSGDFAPAISVNNPSVEKGYDRKHTPDTGEHRRKKEMPKITDHTVYGKYHNGKRYWKIAKKEMIKGNDTIHFLSVESNKVALTESGEPAYLTDFETMKNITLPNDMECLQNIGQAILDIAKESNGKKK